MQRDRRTDKPEARRGSVEKLFQEEGARLIQAGDREKQPLSAPRERMIHTKGSGEERIKERQEGGNWTLVC